MTRVLIVGKTRMHRGVCVGGLTLGEGQAVRLLPERGRAHPADTPFEVGQVWEVELTPASDAIPPHVEDMRIGEAIHLDDLADPTAAILDMVEPWEGAPDALFDGLLRATESGKGMIERGDPLPPMSTGFWFPEEDLSRTSWDDQFTFHYPSATGIRALKYVGLAPAPEEIPAGTLVRVSLATWWAPEGEPARCYLQLSGVF